MGNQNRRRMVLAWLEDPRGRIVLHGRPLALMGERRWVTSAKQAYIKAGCPSLAVQFPSPVLIALLRYLPSCAILPYHFFRSLNDGVPSGGSWRETSPTELPRNPQVRCGPLQELLHWTSSPKAMRSHGLELARTGSRTTTSSRSRSTRRPAAGWGHIEWRGLELEFC